jgi:hypothetical protein
VFDWLFEGRISVYIGLGACAFVMLYLWRQQRRRPLLYIGVFLIALIGLYWLLDRLVETDREVLENTVLRMTGAVAERKLDVSFSYISENFRSPNNNNKEHFRALAEKYLGSGAGQVSGVDVLWRCEFPERPDRTSGKEAKVNFHFKLRGEFGGKESFYYLCESIFIYEPPGVWRLLRCRILNPTKNEEVIDLEF